MQVAYNLSRWSDFFVMVGGAAAVLVGLLFVVFAIRVEQSGTRALRSGPRSSVAFLGVSLVVSAVALMPQSRIAAGTETALTGAIGLAIYADDLRYVVAGGVPQRLKRWGPLRIALLGAEVWGGISVAIASGGGCYVIAVGVTGLLASSIQSAWWALNVAPVKPKE